MQIGQSRGYPADNRYVPQPDDAEQRPGKQRQERAGQISCEASRPERSDDERDRRDGQRVVIDVFHRIGHGANRAQDAARRRRGSEKRQDVNHHDDDPDSGHEPGDDHVRRIGDETPDPRQPEEHLQQTGHHDHCQGF